MDILDPIFTAADMQYCSVPVPPIDAHKDGEFEFTASQIAGYGQSQTHPSIVFIPGGWNGHEYWLASTPYPNAIGVFENPCIYYGDADGDGNPPRIFTPISGTASGNYIMVNNPVVKVPNNTNINSDPDLWFDNDNQIMYLISRYNNTTPMRGYLQNSVSGQAWTQRDNSLYCAMPNQPSLLRVGSSMKIVGTSASWATYNPFDGYIPDYYRGTFKIFSGDITDITSFSTSKWGTLSGKTAINPYHSSCFTDPDSGKYYAIFVGSDWKDHRNRIFLAESSDGYDWFIFARPILAPCEMAQAYYRPTACVRGDRMLVVYWSTTKGIKTDPSYYPNGAGDVPVDGRTIGVSYRNFDAVLQQLRDGFVTNMV